MIRLFLNLKIYSFYDMPHSFKKLHVKLKLLIYTNIYLRQSFGGKQTNKSTDTILYCLFRYESLGHNNNCVGYIMENVLLWGSDIYRSL